jgi:hypothetical protein
VPEGEDAGPPTHRKRRIPAPPASDPAPDPGEAAGYGATNVPTSSAPFTGLGAGGQPVDPEVVADPVEPDVAPDVEWVVVFETTSSTGLRDAFELLVDEGFTARTRVSTDIGLSTGLVDLGEVLVAAEQVERAERVLADADATERWDGRARRTPTTRWSEPTDSATGPEGLSTGVLILVALVVVGILLVAVL